MAIGKFLATGLIMAAAALGAACSTNDKNVKTSAEGAKAAEPKIRKTAPGARRDYPNLGSVPRTRPDTGTTQQRLEIEQGLYADRRNARYIDGPKAGDEERGRTGTTTRRNVATRVITPGRGGPVTGAARRVARRPDLALRVGRGGYVTTIPFANGATSLPPGAGRRIVQVARLHRYSGGTVRVVGHSARGEPAANATARARLVANGLSALGVPRNQIRAAGVGARQARFRDNSKNSRVDIFIVGARRR